MSYLLDTNVCIRFIRGLSPPIAKKLISINRSEIYVCSIVAGELAYGAYKSQQTESNLQIQAAFLDQFESLSFDDQAAQIFGQIRADLAVRGQPIGPYDLQIAAIALANDLTLVTHNVREFGRIADLKIEDWEA